MRPAMTAQLYLSHARLLAPQSAATDEDRPAEQAHRALWSLFEADDDDKAATRDFQWRDEGESQYVLLSRRPPTDGQGLFELTSQQLAAFSGGDTFNFTLRVNPVVTSARATDELDKHGNRARGKKIDVVQHAMTMLPKGASLAQRAQATYDAGKAWLDAQGSKAGFKLIVPPVVATYAPATVDGQKSRIITFTELDISGQIEITDPVAFVAKLATGFGSAKAYGNGLMLLSQA
jgi:CRISPR system Cascade subunit CasE